MWGIMWGIMLVCSSSYSEDSEEVMKNARLKSAMSVVTLVGECPVCLRPVGGACSMRRFPCGHMFCLVCCVDHILARLAVRVSTGKSAMAAMTTLLLP